MPKEHAPNGRTDSVIGTEVALFSSVCVNCKALARSMGHVKVTDIIHMELGKSDDAHD